ncbi:MAG TPA: ComEC/Rec2 family competence protein [Candidatus Krumholzibacteria bacterium]|nr:ComEC/Rec2 family competence protein [Candidatus Krumholzibacteria bacterium]
MLRITGWPARNGERWRAPAVVLHARDAETGDALASLRPWEGVLLQGEGPPPAPGDRLAARWRRSPPRDPAVADGFSERTFLGARGLGWRLRADEAVVLPPDALARILAPAAALRGALARTLGQAYPPREAALLQAVLLGERGGARDPARDGFTRLGLAHLFAVSGLHVGILAGFTGALLGALRCPPTWRAPLTAGLLWGYAGVTGAAPSTVRAAAMATLLLGARGLGGRAAPGHGLLLVFWATQAWSPASLADPGLRLSFLAVAGILVGVQAAGAWEPPRAARPLRDGLAVSLGAQTGTAPAVAAGFGFLAPWSPLVNLAAVPLFGLAVWLAVLGLVLAPVERLAAGPATAAWLLLRGLEGLASWLDGWLGRPPAVSPWGPLRWGVALAAAAVLSRAAPRRRLAAAALLLLLPWWAPPRPGGAMEAVQFDIDQGDAAALIFPDGRCVLIDTGPAWDVGGPLVRDALPWLRRRGVRRLAGVALTHAHADHDGCADAVAAEFPVDAWWLGGRCAPPPDTPPHAIHRPQAGDTLLASSPWVLLCLGGGAPDAHENDRSLAVGLFRDGRPAGLWTGDQEAAGEAATLATGLLDGGPWDVFKAGHHGSRTSSTPALLDRARPAVILISCGVANRHRHPSHGVFTALGDTLPLRRTDLEGTLQVRWRGPGAPEIRGSRPPP